MVFHKNLVMLLAVIFARGFFFCSLGEIVNGNDHKSQSSFPWLEGPYQVNSPLCKWPRGHYGGRLLWRVVWYRVNTWHFMHFLQIPLRPWGHGANSNPHSRPYSPNLFLYSDSCTLIHVPLLGCIGPSLEIFAISFLEEFQSGTWWGELENKVAIS